MITFWKSGNFRRRPMFRIFSFRIRAFAIFLLCAIPFTAARAGEPKWLYISSSHFLILTDANRDRGDVVALRFEQMYTLFGQLLVKNKLNLSQPLDIIALAGQNGYQQVAPVRDGKPISAPGFTIPGDDRFYVVLNAERPDDWRAVSYSFARWLLQYNYPPTPAWFDEGFAEYFSGADFQEKQAFIGGEPSGGPPILSGNSSQPVSLAKILQASAWIPLSDLFAMRSESANASQNRRALFQAESWIVVHYIFTNNQMPELGAYFGLVEGQHLPVADAIKQAFGMSSAQLEQAVKSYFASHAHPVNATQETSPASDQFSHPIPLPESGLEVGTSVQSVPSIEAQALLAEMEVRLPEHRKQGQAQLESLLKQSSATQAIGYRSLAWIALQKDDFPDVKKDLDQALDADQNDAMSHYYFTQMEYRLALTRSNQAPELANMLVGIREVTDKYPEFAEAYNLLAVARLEGGGLNSALDAIQTAIQLAPRCESCVLHLAQIYLAQSKWDQARLLLQQLKLSSDPQVAQSAAKALKDLPYLMKYGVALNEESQAQGQGSASSQSDSDDDDSQTTGAQSDDKNQSPAKPVPDTRPVKFLSGEILSVECSNPAQAVLKLKVRGRLEVVRVDDYNNVAVIGAGGFSCDWKDQKVSLNYRGQSNSMDIVSIELQ